MRDQTWSADALLEMARGYQAAAVLVAAAELNLFEILSARKAVAAAEIATDAHSDPRAMQILLDALAALGLVKKSAAMYQLPDGLDQLLTGSGRGTVLGMVRHQGNCLRKWAQLGQVVKSGRNARAIPSVRGAEGDLASFIEAMHNISAPVADAVIASIQPLQFNLLLDIGGASGTWTAAFLKACPSGKAILLDLPEVIEMARPRLDTLGLSHRVEYAASDYNSDPLPKGADLAWLSAIVHQNSPQENQDLLRRVHAALAPGGRIAIRDIVMESDRSKPPAGALFAVNMLAATEGGATFTFAETKQWLEAAGFHEVALARKDPGMHAIIVARKHN